MNLYVEGELKVTQEVFGQDATQSIVGSAASIYEKLPFGVQDGEKIDRNGMARTKKAVPKSGEAVMAGFNKYASALAYNIFVLLMRLFILAKWLMVLGPVLIAGVTDGFAQRAIKRAEFGAIRPAAFTLTAALVVPLTMGPLLYLVSPITVSPMVLPLWALIVCIPLALMVSNMQPIFGKS